VCWRMRIASKGFRELRRDVGGGRRGRRGIVRIAGEKRDVSYDSFVRIIDEFGSRVVLWPDKCRKETYSFGGFLL
jgi:hypothetical protein